MFISIGFSDLVILAIIVAGFRVGSQYFNEGGLFGSFFGAFAIAIRCLIRDHNVVVGNPSSILQVGMAFALGLVLSGFVCVIIMFILRLFGPFVKADSRTPTFRGLLLLVVLALAWLGNSMYWIHQRRTFLSQFVVTELTSLEDRTALAPGMLFLLGEKGRKEIYVDGTFQQMDQASILFPEATIKWVSAKEKSH